MKTIDTKKMIYDTDKWKNEVEPIVGKTDLYVYPYGEWEIEIENKESKKQAYLKKSGFSMFFGVGSSGFVGNLPFNKNIAEKSYLMDRIPMDGFSLRNSKNKFKNFFNVEDVFDYENRVLAHGCQRTGVDTQLIRL